jgi:hypothetical protein
MIGEAHVLATQTLPPWLSQDPLKRGVYCDDLYFWDGWEAFAAACPGEPAQATLRQLTFTLIKPEAIVGRRIEPILDFVQALGFGIAGAWPVRLTRHAVRALWGYQINSVPIAWVHALELGITSGELFVVGLTHPLARGEASSAAELLRVNKGTSARPGGDMLRDRLNGPARMLSFVHAPDEPADVIRELAVVCDGSGRAGAAAELGTVIAALVGALEATTARSAEVASSARSSMTSRYGQSVVHDLNVDATFSRMRGYLRAGRLAGLPPATLAAIENGWTEPSLALEVVTSLERAQSLPVWDRIVTVAHLTDSLRNGRSMLITPPV